MTHTGKEESKSPERVLGAITRRLAVAGVAALACLGATGPQEAHAESHGGPGIRPYAGVGVEFLSLDLGAPPAGFSTEPIADNHTAVNAHLGARLGDWVGAELGFFQTGKEEQDLMVENDSAKTEVDIRGLSLDLLGHLPIRADGTDLIGSIGISRVTYGVSATGDADVPTEKQAESVPRLGLGIQHRFGENLSVRGLYRRYNAGDLDRVADGFHLGVNYHFGRTD